MAFLQASASIRLAPGVSWSQGVLVDAHGVEFDLNPAGDILCSIADEPVSLRVVIDEVSASLAMERAECEIAIIRFVTELHRRRLISVHQSFAQEILADLALLPGRLASVRTEGWRVLVADRQFYRRYAATVPGLLRGCLEAHQASMWVLVALVALFAAAPLFVGAPSPYLQLITIRALAIAFAWYSLLHWAALCVHELCHLVVARLCGAELDCFYVRGGAMGLSFRTTSRTRRIAIVVAGALGAELFLAPALVFVLAAPAQFWVSAALDQLRLSAVVAVLALMTAQLLWLTPIAHDGRELWSAVLPRRALERAT